MLLMIYSQLDKFYNMSYNKNMKQFEKERMLQYQLLLNDALQIQKESYNEQGKVISKLLKLMNERQCDIKSLEDITKELMRAKLFKYPEFTFEQAEAFQEILTMEYDEDEEDDS